MMKVSFLFIVALLSGVFAHAQIAKDTIIHGKPFIIHTVQSQETLYGIAREYNAELNEIVVQNPSVIQGLKIGVRLLVPQAKSKLDPAPRLNPSNVEMLELQEVEWSKPLVVNDSSVTRVALLLPFYLDMNDTLEAHNESKAPAAIYQKSKTALDFYSGVRLALDTLSSLGYNVDLNVLDVPNDSVFNALLDSTVLDDRALIFGPLYIRQFQKMAARFAADTNRILVSPLSYKNAVSKYSNTYQIVPLAKSQLDTLTGLIKARHQTERLVVLSQKSEESLVKHAKAKLLSEPSPLTYKQYQFAEGELPNKERLYKLLDESRNVVLIPSNDRSFVSRVLPMFGGMKDTSFTVYGLDSWNRFDNLDMDDLVNLDVHIPSVFYSSQGGLYDAFVHSYYQQYADYPSKYAFTAYQQMLAFIAPEFADLFSFETYNFGAGYLNSAFPIIRYKDYKQQLVESILE